jgi:putative peptide zinc metalloprotease protein
VTPPLETSSASTTSSIHGVAADGGPVISSTSASPGRPDATPRPPVPVPATGIELFGETPGSGYREPPSLVRRSDGQTVQLTPLLYEVLHAIDGRRNYYEIAEHVGDRIGRTASPADMLFLVEAKLRPLGLLRGHDGSEPELERVNPLLALRCRFVISRPELTRRITQPFAVLFRPALVVFFVAAFVWTTWWTFFEQGMAPSIRQAFYEPQLLLLVFALTLVSAGFHEFGHAAACRYGGATPGAMGFGLYLIWPAFYTDVTDSYRLGRRGRLRVDLGGLYFNMVFAVGTFAAWAWLRADALLLLIVAQVLQMSRQLAPLVRFDGYHILSDLIGVPDLFAHMKPTLLGMLPWRWRRGQHHALKPWARVAITLWVLVVLPLLLIMLVTIVMILPRLAATVWDSLGIQWEVLGQNWAAGEMADVGIRLLSIISLALPVLTVTYLIARVVRRAAAWLWRVTEGSVGKRALGGIGAVAVIAAVAFAWWPHGQYVPVDAEEKGTLPELFDFVELPAPELIRAAEEEPPTPTVAAPATDLAPAPLAAPAPNVPPAGSVGPPKLGVVLIPSGTVPEPAARTEPAPPTSDLPVADAEIADGIILTDGLLDADELLLDDIVVADEVLLIDADLLEPGAPVSDIDQPPAGDAPSDGGTDWPFPWRSPAENGEGDNRAAVFNTEDGSTVYDVALAFLWVTDGGPADQRNEALAYASCRDCKSVAVAFQVILIVGQVDEITPFNTSEAGNFECEDCTTHALAMQLIVTLREAPDDAVLEELATVWAALDHLEANIESLTLEEVYGWLRYTELQILGILTRAGGEVEGAADEQTTERSEGDLPDAGSDQSSLSDAESHQPEASSLQVAENAAQSEATSSEADATSDPQGSTPSTTADPTSPGATESPEPEEVPTPTPSEDSDPAGTAPGATTDAATLPEDDAASVDGATSEESSAGGL